MAGRADSEAIRTLLAVGDEAAQAVHVGNS